MNTVTLHFRADRLHKTCAVCGADMNKGSTNRWWLRNTWTDKRHHYGEGEGCWPGDWMVPCGRLPDDSKTPNAGNEGREASRSIDLFGLGADAKGTEHVENHR